MTRKRKKVVKMRGQRTHGWGSKKKHRGSGSRGGVGMAGMFKHKKVWAFKNRPGYFKKKGFTTLRMKKIKPETKAISLKALSAIMADRQLKELDVGELGYTKVLGSGSLSIPLIIKATAFSDSAREKISAAGGKAIEN